MFSKPGVSSDEYMTIFMPFLGTAFRYISEGNFYLKFKITNF